MDRVDIVDPISRCGGPDWRCARDSALTGVSESRLPWPANPRGASVPFDQDTTYASDTASSAPGAAPNPWDITRPIRTVRMGNSPTRGRPESPSRTPSVKQGAPLLVRLSVTMLLLVLLATVGGSLYARGHPKWLIGLRNIAPSASPVETTALARTLVRVTLVSSSSTAIVYRVPASSYSVIITVDHPTWIVVRSPASSSSPLVAETLVPSASPLTLALHTSAAVTVSARTRSIAILSGSQVLETINDPVLEVTYTFEPEAS